MLSAPIVIAAAICALVVIYFLPRLDAAGRRAYSRWRRRKRDLRHERERQERVERRASQ